MANSLSIRSYSKQRRGHHHAFCQLVLPLRGVIHIELEGYRGKVAPRECVFIPRDAVHHFTAEENARFLVADLDEPPGILQHTPARVFSISAALLRYLEFVELQLQQEVHAELEQIMMQTFRLLLEQQTLMRQSDSRIRDVQSYIADHLADNISINQLAAVACLSATQLKKRFYQQLGQSVMEYVRHQRMEKARALLQHTDYPVQRIAEAVGYQDASAFSRRFSLCYGLSPREISRR